MKKLVLGICALGMVTTASAKFGDCVKGIGTPIKEKRVVGSYQGIELNGSADVYMYQSDKDYVRVEAQFNIIPLITTVNKDGIVIIDTKEGECFNATKDVIVHVYSSNFESVHVKGSGDVYTETSIKVDKLDLDLKGSGDIDLQNVKIKEVNAKIKGSGDINIAAADTSARVNLSIMGSGDINLIDAPTLKANTEVKGSGDIKLHAIETLDAKVSGSGSVIYKGQPTINQSVNGSGEVKGL